jgi:dolichol-phosphate mannosyltransferase
MTDVDLETAKETQMLVVVCTFNEAENLPSLLEQIFAALPTADVLVVDDDSPDGTGSWAARQAADNGRLHVMIRKEDRGLGAALRAGLRWALERNYRWILNLDADHSHDPADLPRLLEVAQGGQPPLDCVVGTRYASGGQIEGWNWRRRWMSRMVNRFATGVLRLPVSDCSGSLRCYRADALRSIELAQLRSRGYAIFEEILVRLRRSGARFDEVPITFHERRSGDSKLTLGEAVQSAAQIIRMAGMG